LSIGYYSALIGIDIVFGFDRYGVCPPSALSPPVVFAAMVLHSYFCAPSRRLMFRDDVRSCFFTVFFPEETLSCFTSENRLVVT
jgi:hypothetical protein